VNTTYPDLIHKYTEESFLQSRAILASRIEIVNQINEYMLSLILGMPMEVMNL